MSLGPGSDPDLLLGQHRSLQEDRFDGGQWKRRHGPRREPCRGQDLVGGRNPGRGGPDRARELRRVGPPVARNERDDGAAVTDEDEGLDDLRRGDPERLRGALDCRGSLGELLEPGLGVRGVEEVGDALNGLREHARNRTGLFGVVSLMSAELVRLATTESIFRNVNERIAASAQRFDADEADFVCECDDRACTHRLETSLDAYERVRAKPTHFLLAPGHENEAIEKVVQRRRRFHVVEKFEHTVAGTARRLNPRKPKPRTT